jgi:hypothetical protein
LTLMYFYISTFRSMCAVPNMAVFCSSLMSWFPGMVLTYFLNDFEMVPKILLNIIIIIIIISCFLFLSNCCLSRNYVSRQRVQSLMKMRALVMFNLLKPTGYVMHQPVKHSTTVRSAHTVFMCFVLVWEQTATCTTYSINWLVL